MEKYLYYVLEDFVVDDAFREWVISPTEMSAIEWNQFISEHPEKKALIEQSVLIVRSLNPVEKKISGERIQNIWCRIMKDRKPSRLHILTRLVRYAAVFIIAFLSGFGVYHFSKPYSDYTEIYTEVNVPYGERSQITLYDGTKVWLNSGTTLKFPLVFNANQRKVFVTGEAFFDVSKNKKRPFIVSAGQMNIKVLGTRFNVCAYPDDHRIYTTLEEGNIIASNTITGEKVQLRPGDQATFHLETNKITLQAVNTELYTSWKENMLRFENAKFADVVKKMERWYDVKIDVDKAIDPSRRYTMTIKTESLREMLRLLSFTTPMKYEIKEDHVFIQKQ
ncbi:MAG: FecR domain-containing protein [Peptostreptococcaceae bacterium]|nr:FecR domain-containing protein [Peptostreptococcaceae bacterium]